MKIGELEQHCGNCKIIQYCAEPFDELCLCGVEALQEMEETDYIKTAEEIQSRNKRRIGNKKMCKRICKIQERKIGRYENGSSC